MATHTSSPRMCVARKKRLSMKVGEDEQEAARVFYVAATRATQRLLQHTLTMAKKVQGDMH
jgi:ATP-dependent exoDNAse (exonuclease V) beta subunit